VEGCSCASAGAALVEVELGYGLGVGRVERGCLVEVLIEVEGEFRGSTGGSERRRRGGQAEVFEDGVHGFGLSEGGEDAQLTAAGRAQQRQDLVDAGEQASPPRTVDAEASRRGAVPVGGAARVGRGAPALSADGAGRAETVGATLLELGVGAAGSADVSG
jgi:hypothetical protein